MAHAPEASTRVRAHKAAIAGGARHGVSANPVVVKAAKARGPVKPGKRGY